MSDTTDQQEEIERLKAEIERLHEIMRGIWDIHKPDADFRFCVGCDRQYPCPTARVRLPKKAPRRG